MKDAKERALDFDRFLDRCTQEFMMLGDEPRFIISGNEINYAPNLPIDSNWREAGESALRQVRFSAPFLYRQEVGYGLLNFDRPVLAIKFGNEIYWRTVPRRYAKESVEEAKKRKVYADINIQPVRRATQSKSKDVMAFVNSCYGLVVQDAYPYLPAVKISYKSKEMTLRFDESCKLQYEFTRAHLKAGRTLDKIIEVAHWLTSAEKFDFGFSGVHDLLTLQLRCEDVVSLFQCPDSLMAEAHEWAEKNKKLIASPYAIVSDKVRAIGSK